MAFFLSAVIPRVSFLVGSDVAQNARATFSSFAATSVFTPCQMRVANGPGTSSDPISHHFVTRLPLMCEAVPKTVPKRVVHFGMNTTTTWFKREKKRTIK